MRNSFCEVWKSGERAPSAAISWSIVTVCGVAAMVSPRRGISVASIAGLTRRVSGETAEAGSRPIR